MANTEGKNKNSKIMLILLLDVVIISALIFYFGIIRPAQKGAEKAAIKIDGVFFSQPTEISDFNLTDNHGRAFTRENLKGHWTMMFFGFTNCAMVCPTTLDSLNKMYHQMQKEMPANQLPQIAFISVDPDRDTIEKINDYVTGFNTHFIGARAEIPETIALEKQLHIVAAKMNVDYQGENHYTINHSAEILLFNPQAKLQAYFSYPHEPEQMVKDYKLILTTLKG